MKARTETGPDVLTEPTEETAVIAKMTSQSGIDVGKYAATALFLERIPREFAREHLIMSRGAGEGGEQLAVSSSTSPSAVFNTGVRLGRPIVTMIADGEAIARAVDDAYALHAKSHGDGDCEPNSLDGQMEHDRASIDRLIVDADRDLLSTAGKAPVVRLVDALLFDALGRGASDIHVQPMAKTTLVRYRLDGVLHTVRQISPAVARAVVSRIKIMGRMDIAERRMPQDGRATVSIGQSRAPTESSHAVTIGVGSSSGRGGRSVDLRLSTLPTSEGERIVVRLLDHSIQVCDLDHIGMPPEVIEQYLERATQPTGIILVTGPTGSGKTTTLYSTLMHLGRARAGSNIMTIEDPIEYNMSSAALDAAGPSVESALAISQSQVNARKGITFVTGLRHILRQDPDIIMVGEIRDAETARIAIQSALTGHLVFSTLHTSDAASAVTRLFDLGVEPYLASDSLSAVLAQRLVRTIHGVCAGTGCDECLETGFRGRTGIFELLVVDEGMRERISRASPLAEIRSLGRSAGMRTLAEDGARVVHEGRTTQREIDRVVFGAMM